MVDQTHQESAAAEAGNGYGATGIGQQRDVDVRLVRPGEGEAVVAVAAGVDAPGIRDGDDLQDALDRFGGHLELPDLVGGSGWCFAAFTTDGPVGMLYACSPVKFIQSFRPDHHEELAKTLTEIEIFAVDSAHRTHGIGTALITYAEQYLARRGTQLLVAKVDATDRQAMLFYRHRGYTLARNGESCYIDTPEGQAGINAGPVDNSWRLAAKSPAGTITRRGSGLWLTTHPDAT
jgi:GNAT superfamily N-acetyltransferase